MKVMVEEQIMAYFKCRPTPEHYCQDEREVDEFEILCVIHFEEVGFLVQVVRVKFNRDLTSAEVLERFQDENHSALCASITDDEKGWVVSIHTYL